MSCRSSKTHADGVKLGWAGKTCKCAVAKAAGLCLAVLCLILKDGTLRACVPYASVTRHVHRKDASQSHSALCTEHVAPVDANLNSSNAMMCPSSPHVDLNSSFHRNTICTVH